VNIWKFCVKQSPKVEKKFQIFKENGQIFVYLVEVGTKKINKEFKYFPFHILLIAKFD
jgi:hypothetical protein